MCLKPRTNRKQPTNTTAISVKCLYINMTVLSLPLSQSNRDTHMTPFFTTFALEVKSLQLKVTKQVHKESNQETLYCSIKIITFRRRLCFLWN